MILPVQNTTTSGESGGYSLSANLPTTGMFASAPTVLSNRKSDLGFAADGTAHSYVSPRKAILNE